MAAPKALELDDDQGLVVGVAKQLVLGFDILMPDAGGDGFELIFGYGHHLPLEVRGNGFGLFKGGAQGRGHLDEQAVGIVLGEQHEGHQGPDEAHDQREAGQGDRQSQGAMAQHPFERAPVSGLQVAHERPWRELAAGANRRHVRRQNQEGLHQRERQHDDHHGGDLPNDLAGDAAQGDQGRKRQHGGQGGGGHGRRHLRGAGQGGLRRRQAAGLLDRNAFGDHHGVIHDHAQHYDEPG